MSNITITKTFASKGALTNVKEDLVGEGIPQEKIYLDKEKLQVKVIIPESGKSEILEILGRHKPVD